MSPVFFVASFITATCWALAAHLAALDGTTFWVGTFAGSLGVLTVCARAFGDER